jgi:hypothetical protein
MPPSPINNVEKILLDNPLALPQIVLTTLHEGEGGGTTCYRRKGGGNKLLVSIIFARDCRLYFERMSGTVIQRKMNLYKED